MVETSAILILTFEEMEKGNQALKTLKKDQKATNKANREQRKEDKNEPHMPLAHKNPSPAISSASENPDRARRPPGRRRRRCRSRSR